jgi:hypothetical protein
MRDLLCFAVDENVSVHDIEARSSLILDPTSSLRKPKDIKVLFESIRFQKTLPRIEGHKILFRFAHIAANPQIMIQAWIDLLNRSNPAMNLFLSARAGEITYLNFRFLSLAQALETYHQRSLPTSAPKPNQRARLKEMIAKFSKYFGNEDAQAKLVSLTVDTRNYFTHYDLILREKAAAGRALWELYCKLEVLFQLHLLKDMGFDDPILETLVNQNSDIQEKLSKPIVMDSLN